MWTPKQKRDKEIPYRGEAPQEYPKRRRQLRNLKAEKRTNIVTLLIVFIFLTTIALCIIFNPYNSNNSNKLEQGILAFIFVLILMTPIASGLLSINKFRKGQDVDLSKRAKKEKDKNIED